MAEDTRPFLVAFSGFELGSNLKDDPCPVWRSLHLADTGYPIETINVINITIGHK